MVENIVYRTCIAALPWLSAAASWPATNRPHAPWALRKPTFDSYVLAEMCRFQHIFPLAMSFQSPTHHGCAWSANILTGMGIAYPGLDDITLSSTTIVARATRSAVAHGLVD